MRNIGSKGESGKVLEMTEFIPYASPSFNSSETNKEERDLQIVYNPAKGMHYTDEIIRRACGKKVKTDSDGVGDGWWN